MTRRIEVSRLLVSRVIQMQDKVYSDFPENIRENRGSRFSVIYDFLHKIYNMVCRKWGIKCTIHRTDLKVENFR